MYRITEQESPIPPGEQATVTLPIPPTEPSLFRHKATSDILRLLVDNPYERFTIRKLARLTDHSAQSVKRAVDVLEPNSVVVVETQGNRRLVGINRQRISKPDDPVLGITRSEFHPPVRTALDRLQAELGHILGALVFGSVARGRADR
jgi:predicted nucleotidyltransferase